MESFMYRLGRFVCQLAMGVGPEDDYTRITSSKLANATTPDQLIGAHLVESFAKDFDDWVINRINMSEDREAWYKKYTIAVPDSPNFYIINRVLENKKTGLRLVYQMQGGDTRRDFFVSSGGIYVPLEWEVGNNVVMEYNRINTALAKTKAAAAKAKKEMEENERKWNLAENLLGMKRNEFGALVPLVDPDPCVGHKKDKMCYCTVCDGKILARKVA